MKWIKPFNNLIFKCTFFRYNGYLPQGDRGRRRSKFVLYKRTESNGVKRSKHYIVQSPQTSKAILDANQYSTITAWFRDNVYDIECCVVSKIACDVWGVCTM